MPAAEQPRLTYDTATPEQIAEARATARRRLAELDAEWTPERWAQARREVEQRIANAA